MPLTPNVVIQNVNEDPTDIARRQQRGREQALGEDPNKVTPDIVWDIDFHSPSDRAAIIYPRNLLSWPHHTFPRRWTR